jgi:hypothetical protein
MREGRQPAATEEKEMSIDELMEELQRLNDYRLSQSELIELCWQIAINTANEESRRQTALKLAQHLEQQLFEAAHA